MLKRFAIILLSCLSINTLALAYSLEDYHIIKSSEDNKILYYLNNSNWESIATISDTDLKEKVYPIDEIVNNIKIKLSTLSEIEPYHIQDVTGKNRHVLINPYFIEKVEADKNNLYIYWNDNQDITTIDKTSEAEYELRRYLIND